MNFYDISNLPSALSESEAGSGSNNAQPDGSK